MQRKRKKCKKKDKGKTKTEQNNTRTFFQSYLLDSIQINYNIINTKYNSNSQRNKIISKIKCHLITLYITINYHKHKKMLIISSSRKKRSINFFYIYAKLYNKISTGKKKQMNGIIY